MRDPLLFWMALLTTIYIVVYLARVWPTKHLVSPSSLYAALTAIHFAIPGLMLALEQGPRFINQANGRYAAEAMLFAFVALVSLQFGSLLVNSSLFSRRRGARLSAKRNWSSLAVLAGFVVLFVIGWAARIHIIESNAYFQILRTLQGELEGPFYAAIRMAELFPLYALCILAIMYWRPGKPPSRLLRFGLAFAVASELAYWLPSGRKEPVILAILLPLLIRYLRSGKLPSAKTVGILLLVVAVLFPAAFMYRNAMETAGTGADLIDTVIAAAETAETGTANSDKTSGEIIFGRISLLEPLSASVRLSKEGDWEPMLGSSYAEALLSFAPRFIWPDKPDFHYGTEFGHAAGFLSSGDWLTSISVTYFGEAFLNFAWGGVFPMFVMGMILGGLYRQMSVSVRQETWLLVYVIALPTVLYIGGTFALHFGGLIKLLPFFFIVGWMMESRPTRYWATSGQLVAKI